MTAGPRGPAVFVSGILRAWSSKGMPWGPPMPCTPGEAFTKACTTSSWPSIAALKMVGRAPWAISNSAMSRRPMCDAAPKADSQSPKPQSQAALARAGRAVTRALTWSRSLWAAPTTAWTSAGSWLGNARVGAGAGAATASNDHGPKNLAAAPPRATAAPAVRKRRRVRTGMAAPGSAEGAGSGPARLIQEYYGFLSGKLPGPGQLGSPHRGASSTSTPRWSQIRCTMKSTRSATDCGRW